MAVIPQPDLGDTEKTNKKKRMTEIESRIKRDHGRIDFDYDEYGNMFNFRDAEGKEYSMEDIQMYNQNKLRKAAVTALIGSVAAMSVGTFLAMH